MCQYSYALAHDKIGYSTNSYLSSYAFLNDDINLFRRSSRDNLVDSASVYKLHTTSNCLRSIAIVALATETSSIHSSLL